MPEPPSAMQLRLRRCSPFAAISGLLALAGGLLLGAAVAAQEPVEAGPAAAEFRPQHRGKLFVSPMEWTPCLNETAFVRGQEVLLTGDGFLAREPVELVFSQDDAKRPLQATRADSEGVLSLAAVIPVDAATDREAHIDAIAREGAGGGGLELHSPPLQIFADARDSDADGVKDMCDNCPNAANPGLEDADGDSIGDACDRCPADADNDGDQDGLCADVDPDPYLPQASEASGR